MGADMGFNRWSKEKRVGLVWYEQLPYNYELILTTESCKKIIYKEFFPGLHIYNYKWAIADALSGEVLFRTREFDTGDPAPSSHKEWIFTSSGYYSPEMKIKFAEE